MITEQQRNVLNMQRDRAAQSACGRMDSQRNHAASANGSSPAATGRSSNTFYHALRH